MRTLIRSIGSLSGFWSLSTAPLAHQVIAALIAWFVLVAATAASLRNWWVLELSTFPSIVFIWMLRNEKRLKSDRPDLKPLSRNARIHLFLTVPLLVGLRLILSVSQAAKEPDAWRLMLAISFGLAWVLVLLYAFAIVARKRMQISQQ